MKFQHGISTTQCKYLFRKSKEGSFHQQLKTDITGINDFDVSSSKKIIYRRNAKCTSGRKAVTVCETMGKNNTRPRNFVNRERVSETIYKSPSSGEYTKHNKNVRTTISASAPRNISLPREGSYSESKNSSRGVSEQHFSCGKEGWEKPSGDKSEKTKCIHPLQALQNGKFALPEISSGTKQFPLQDRSQRRLPCNCSQQTVIKICKIQEVRPTLPVSLPLF